MEKKKNQVTNILMAVIAMLFILSAAVVITLHFRPLYRWDVAYFDLERTSGMPQEQIMENYDELIRYNSIFSTKELDFPSLPMSESGKIHFEEVRRIFILVEVICMVTLVLLLAGIVLKHKQKDGMWLKYASLATVLVPALFGLLIAMNWQQFFVTFHKIFFNNDYWIFNAATDPVITILPDGYFMHCAIMILGIVIMSSAVCFVLYKRNARKALRYGRKSER